MQSQELFGKYRKTSTSVQSLPPTFVHLFISSLIQAQGLPLSSSTYQFLQYCHFVFFLELLTLDSLSHQPVPKQKCFQLELKQKISQRLCGTNSFFGIILVSKNKNNNNTLSVYRTLRFTKHFISPLSPFITMILGDR